jgi:hypothetical protein
MLGLKMDTENFYLTPFKTIGFTLREVELAGTRFTVKVEPGWTKALVNGQTQDGQVRVPRSQRVVKIEFIK